MKIEKAQAREKKQFKSKYGMRVSNKSIFILDRVSKGLRKRK
jgi:hypothetical protein